jgi:chromosome segregation ATPase
VEKVKKMYQVYVENSLALLETQESDPDRYSRKMAQFELDDEYLKRLKEVLEMRAELQKELARILGDDPRLLRRFMDSLRKRSNNLREELAGLVEKQNDLNREVRAWALVDEANRPQIAKTLLMRHAQRTAAMATAAGKLQESYETWLPLNREVMDADLAAATKRIQAVATAADELNAAAGRYISAAQPVAAPPATQAEAEAPAAAADGAKPQAAATADCRAGG